MIYLEGLNVMGIEWFSELTLFQNTFNHIHEHLSVTYTIPNEAYHGVSMPL